jgi:sRNA-binding regulator protein Hfq
MAFAQQNYQDVVYLKNGSIIRGLIVEQVPNETIKIETMDKSVFVYKLDEIAKIAKEEKKGHTYSNTPLKTGSHAIAEVGYGLKTGDYGLDVLKLNLIYSYRLDNNFSLGLGTGIRHYSEDGESATLVPVFADFRANLVANNLMPYFGLGIGYSFDASDSFSGVGILVNPTVGVGFKTQGSSILHVSLGLETQRLKGYLYDGYYMHRTAQTTKAISLNVGISF